MDFLNKAKEQLSSNSTGAQNGGQPAGQPAGQQQPQQGGASGQEDYGDKALDFIEKKTGHNLSRDQNEKITDGARSFYEKQTGQVNQKYSN